MSVREELQFLLHVFKDPITYSWSAPIATLIKREPDVHGWQDACLIGAGGFSFDLQFWWMVEWSPTIANRTICFLSKGNRHLVSINALEYVAIIFGLAGSILVWEAPRLIVALFIQQYCYGLTTLQPNPGQNTLSDCRDPKAELWLICLHTY
jgi:hypothetical protein